MTNLNMVIKALILLVLLVSCGCTISVYDVIGSENIVEDEITIKTTLSIDISSNETYQDKIEDHVLENMMAAENLVKQFNNESIESVGTIVNLVNQDRITIGDSQYIFQLAEFEIDKAFRLVNTERRINYDTNPGIRIESEALCSSHNASCFFSLNISRM